MISEFVEYVKQAWKNKPNVSSPLNADRLNHMEDGIENNSKKIKEIVPAVNELTDKMTISKVDLLAQIKDGSVIIDAKSYKYLYIDSSGGARLIPTDVLNIINKIDFSLSRDTSSDYFVHIFMSVSLTKCDVHGYEVNGYAKGNISLYGIS